MPGYVHQGPSCCRGAGAVAPPASRHHVQHQGELGNDSQDTLGGHRTANTNPTERPQTTFSGKLRDREKAPTWEHISERPEQLRLQSLRETATQQKCGESRIGRASIHRHRYFQDEGRHPPSQLLEETKRAWGDASAGGRVRDYGSAQGPQSQNRTLVTFCQNVTSPLALLRWFWKYF